MKERVLQLDYLKGVFILLMVTFHLTLVTQTYPMLCKAVYTFHMSAFLIISGYLCNIEKDGKSFAHGMLKLIIPYVIFETIYILMIFFLGKAMHANNSIDNLTILNFAEKIAKHPSGTYWYIHTLIICTIVYFLIYRFFKMTNMTALIMLGGALYGLTIIISGLNWANVIYFLIGVYIYRSGKSFMEMIAPSALAILPLCVLFASSDNYSRGSLAGIIITVLVVSLLLFIYNYSSEFVKNFFCYLGNNSLAIVLFSPIFTILTKMAVPYFSFDPTAVCFTLFALSFVVICCLFCAWFCDKMHLSKIVFYRDTFYVPFK